MWVEIKSVNIANYFPDQQRVEIFGELTADLYVIGANIDGTDQLALTFTVPNAFVNGTVLSGFKPSCKENCEQSMMIDILSVVTNEVHSSNSVFGPVNDLLITRALSMLM